MLKGMLFRVGALLISTTLAVALMLAIPGRAGAPTRIGRWIAAGGRYTMYPYLIHLPMLTVIGWTGWPRDGRPVTTTLAFVLAGVLTSALLVTVPVQWIAGPFVEPRTWAQRVSPRFGRR